MAIAERVFNRETSQFRTWQEIIPPTDLQQPVNKLTSICQELLKPDWHSEGIFSLSDQIRKATKLAIVFENPMRTELEQPTTFRLEDMQSCLSKKATTRSELFFDDDSWELSSSKLGSEFTDAISETPFQHLETIVGFNRLINLSPIKGCREYQMAVVVFELTFSNSRDRMADITDEIASLAKRTLELTTKQNLLIPLTRRTTPLLPPR